MLNEITANDHRNETARSRVHARSSYLISEMTARNFSSPLLFSIYLSFSSNFPRWLTSLVSPSPRSLLLRFVPNRFLLISSLLVSLINFFPINSQLHSLVLSSLVSLFNLIPCYSHVAHTVNTFLASVLPAYQFIFSFLFFSFFRRVDETR